MASLVADVDQFGPHLGQCVVGLCDVGHQPVEFRALLIDEGLETDGLGPGPHRRFLGGDATLLGPAQCGGTVDGGPFRFGRPHCRQCIVHPPVRPLQPQSSDIVDEFGRRAGGDPAPEQIVGLDRPAQASERTGGHTWLAEERAQLVGHCHRGLATLRLLGDQHRIFDRAAQVSMLDLSTLAHDPTLPRPTSPNRRRSARGLPWPERVRWAGRRRRGRRPGPVRFRRPHPARRRRSGRRPT